MTIGHKCKSCGAPLDGPKCEYCGSVYGDPMNRYDEILRSMKDDLDRQLLNMKQQSQIETYYDLATRSYLTANEIRAELDMPPIMDSHFTQRL